MFIKILDNVIFENSEVPLWKLHRGSQNADTGKDFYTYYFDITIF